MKTPRHKKPLCPVTAMASLLSDTWTMLVVHNLIQKSPLRFCELERALDGISTRTLTLKLKYLEEKKIISKDEKGYKVTKLGLKIKPIINLMAKVGNEI